MKRALASIVVLGLWLWFCSYWYVCGVKKLCEEKIVPPGGVEVVITPPTIEEKIPEQIVEEPKPEPVLLKDVHFIFNTTLIKDLSVLDVNIGQIRSYLQENPGSMVYLTGHTCDIGAEKNNFGLGIKRAQAVKDYIVRSGVPERVVVIDSKGSESPSSSGETDIDRMHNRRVEIVVKVSE